MGGIKQAFATGGIWMYLILGVSILAMGVVIERFVFIFFRYNINAHAFMAQIQKLVMANNIDRAIKLCNAVMKRTPTLAALANIATLLGLLGTILGLIDAFQALETATPDKRQEMLARGISLAMNTTAFGLIVAIPTLFAHMLLSSMSRKIVEDIEQYAVKLGNLLVSRTKGG